MRRIVVFGNSGSGKTTLARALMSRTDSPTSTSTHWLGTARVFADHLRRAQAQSVTSSTRIQSGSLKAAMATCWGRCCPTPLRCVSSIPGSRRASPTVGLVPGKRKNTPRRMPRTRISSSCLIGCVSMRVARMSILLDDIASYLKASGDQRSSCRPCPPNTALQGMRDRASFHSSGRGEAPHP
jgi:energy-coupling factor transporter ATP-binding protein EcfA2